MDWHKIITSTGTLITAGIALVTSIIGGIFWLASLNANLSNLQSRVDNLEKISVGTPAEANPVALACIELAKVRAASDRTPAFTSETEKAMSDLGCARLNR